MIRSPHLFGGSCGQPVARTVDAIVIGAGHAGLAFSHCLSERGIEHVVLERGEIAESWRRERWDSLRLLTPNWQSRLPGWHYSGTDPDGFMTMPEVVQFIDGYARRIAAPVHTGTNVTAVTATTQGYRVTTDHGEWWASCVVLATGACRRAAIPRVATALPQYIANVTPIEYRSPNQLNDGGVLVVGASATGVQLADEIQRSGRPVTLAVGEHIRLPRTYRGHDIQRWLQAIGVLDERFDAVDDIVRARRVPSPQLVGTPERSSLDLNVLRARGVRCVGRLLSIVNGKAQFSGSLRNHCAMADLKMVRLLDRIDAGLADNTIEDIDSLDPATDRPAPTQVDANPALTLDLTRGEIKSVVWATGYQADFSWLDVPVFDGKGRIRHTGGVVDSPGLYVMGLSFMRRRASSFMHGAEADARELSEHLAEYVNGIARRGRLASRG